MSRHNRKVPTSFYHRFARDTCALADQYAQGRVISVLEGGYSDRALTSGAMAHLAGLVDIPAGSSVDEEWWNVENLIKVGSFTLFHEVEANLHVFRSSKPQPRNAGEVGHHFLHKVLWNHGSNALWRYLVPWTMRHRKPQLQRHARLYQFRLALGRYEIGRKGRARPQTPHRPPNQRPRPRLVREVNHNPLEVARPFLV